MKTKLFLYYIIYKKLTQNGLIKDLNERAKTVTLLEENIGEKLQDIGFGKNFLDITLKKPATRKTIN